MSLSDVNSNFVVILYKRRWVILAGLMLAECLAGFSFTCFGQMNNFFANFFQVTYADVDWITLSHNVAPTFFLLPLLWAINKRIIGFRKLTVIAVVGFSIEYVCLTASLLNSKLFVVVIVGQLLGGISTSIIMSTSSIFAVLWFPEEEVGTAIAVSSAGMYIGTTLGTVMPTLAVTNNTASSSSAMDSNETEHVRLFLLRLFGGFLAISMVVTTFLTCVVTDRPPTPPTIAQAFKLTSEIKEPLFFSAALKRLASDKNLWLLCFVFMVMVQMITLELIMMSEMLRGVTQHDGISINADRLGGYLLVVWSMGGVFGSVATGKLMDTYKQYKAIGISLNILTVVSTAAFAVGFKFENLPTMFVANFFFGVGSKSAMVLLYELATQHTFPLDETIVSTWLLLWVSPGGIIIGEIGRFLFSSLGSLSVLIFQIVCLLLCLVIMAFLSTESSRLIVKREEMTSSWTSCEEYVSLLREEHKR